MPTLLPLLTTLALPERLSLQGYAELRGSYSPVEQGTPWTAAERLRPTLEWQPTERLGLTLTAEARASQGRYLPDEALTLLDEALRAETGLGLDEIEQLTGCAITAVPRTEDWRDFIGLERAFVDLERPRFDLRLGRQAVAWGSALVFNPTDVFSDVNVAEPWRERPGVDAARLLIPLGDEAQVALVGGVDDLPGTLRDRPDITPWKVGGRATLHAAATDWSLVAVTGGERLDAEASFIGLDLKGGLGLGWWLEGGYDGDLRAAAGLDYSFPVAQSLYLAAQVYHDGSGSNPEDYGAMGLSGELFEAEGCEDLPPNAPIAALTEPPGEARATQGRWYGTLVARLAANDRWGFSASSLVNLADGSALVTPYATYTPMGRLSANLGLNWMTGAQGELNPDPDDMQMQGVDASGLVAPWTALAWLRLSL